MDTTLDQLFRQLIHLHLGSFGKDKNGGSGLLTKMGYMTAQRRRLQMSTTPLKTLCDFPLSSDSIWHAPSYDFGFSRIRPFNSTTVSQPMDNELRRERTNDKIGSTAIRFCLQSVVHLEGLSSRVCLHILLLVHEPQRAGIRESSTTCQGFLRIATRSR